MKITNKMNLPKPFVSAVESDYEYKDKQYSVTALLSDSLRETMLKRRYFKEVEQDVADMIWMIIGNGIHKILEESTESENELKEEYLKIPMGDDYFLSGRADLFNDKEEKVTDYKTCSAWKVIYGDYEDWQKQTLIYGWMFRQIGFKVTKGEIIAIMKDWSSSKAKLEPDYPQYPVKRIMFNFSERDFKYIEEYLKKKFKEIKELEKVKDEELPMCSLKDRFNSGDKYAVKKIGNKRAHRVFDNMLDAKKLLSELGSGYEIEERPGEDKKCLEYCSVCKYCSYWKKRYGGVVDKIN